MSTLFTFQLLELYMILFIIKACLIFMTGHGMSSCSRWHEDTYYHHINIFDLLRFMNSAANFLYFIVWGKCPWRKIIAAEWGDIAVLPLEISDPNAEAACKHDRNALCTVGLFTWRAEWHATFCRVGRITISQCIRYTRPLSAAAIQLCNKSLYV